MKAHVKSLGYGTAPMPTADPKAVEGNCPLCGVYRALNRMGVCYDRDCRDVYRAKYQAQLRETGGDSVDGLYYRVGAIELVNLGPSMADREPVAPIKHPDLCVAEGCDVWALPQDTLCRAHKLEHNQAKYRARKAQREGKARRQKGRQFNRIRGLERLRNG